MAESEGAASTRKRLSLPSAATDASTVAELIGLMEAVTASGRIGDDGITALQEWLAKITRKDLPGIEFLRTAVSKVVESGNITQDERNTLYKVIERVLPPEPRRRAKERRMAVDLIEREAARATKAATDAQEREQRFLNRPVASANFMVAGVTHEGRGRIVTQYAGTGDAVDLIRDPDNAYDRNAIEVRLKGGRQIGFVPREDAARLAPVMDRGCKCEAYITKILDGERAPIPVVDATLYHMNAAVAMNIPVPPPSPRVPARANATQGYIVAKPVAQRSKWAPLVFAIAATSLVLLKACTG